jgi:hypothetical protein
MAVKQKNLSFFNLNIYDIIVNAIKQEEFVTYKSKTYLGDLQGILPCFVNS